MSWSTHTGQAHFFSDSRYFYTPDQWCRPSPCRVIVCVNTPSVRHGAFTCFTYVKYGSVRGAGKGFQHEFRDIMDVQSILFHKNVHILRQTILVLFNVVIILCSSLRKKLTIFSGIIYLIILYYIMSNMFGLRSSHHEGNKAK